MKIKCLPIVGLLVLLIAPNLHAATTLNNFVTELLNVNSPRVMQNYKVNSSRDGWLYISVSTTRDSSPHVRIDSIDSPMKLVGSAFETMRYLPPGVHSIAISNAVRPTNLTVREIGELIYSTYPLNPRAGSATGNYTWSWLQKNGILDNYNIMIGHHWPSEYATEMRQWIGEHKWWMTEEPLFPSPPATWASGTAAYQGYAADMGMSYPGMKGIFADEFNDSDFYLAQYPSVCAGISQLATDPKLKGRMFYGYIAPRYEDYLLPVVTSIVGGGYRLACEYYNTTTPTEAGLSKYYNPRVPEITNHANFDAAYPGAGSDRLMVLATFSQAPESVDIYPNVNYNVFLDRQFQYLSTEPGFAGIRGLLGYYTFYCGEEQVRVFSQLVRHYCIEGRTDLYFSDPYELPHLTNPDFVQGTTGWSLAPASSGSISAKTATEYGWIQGRYNLLYLDNAHVGDTVLWTNRQSGAPNQFSQVIQGLQVGRYYSLHYITSNYTDFTGGVSSSKPNNTSVTIGNATMVPAKTYDISVPSSHPGGAFPSNSFYFYWHQRIFQANATTATLTFSDWASSGSPGGTIGEQLMWNFIKVAPYVPEAP